MRIVSIRARYAAGFIALCALAPTPALAHPHMFLDGAITFEVQETGLEGFWLEWTFDPMFSAMIALDMDTDKDKSFSAAELARVQNDAFSNLRNYGYFTHISQDGQETQPQSVESFQAWIREDRLVYRFYMPHRVPLAAGASQSVSVAVFDDTFFCDCRIAPDAPVSLRGASGLSATWRVVEDSERGIRYSPTDGNVATNLGTRDTQRYTGVFHPTWIVLELARR